MSKKLFFGVVLLLLSYLQLTMPENFINGITLMFFSFLFMFGIILISECVTGKIYGKSLLREAHKNSKKLFIFTPHWLSAELF